MLNRKRPYPRPSVFPLPTSLVKRPVLYPSTGFPRSKVVRLKYAQAVVVNPGVGSIGHHQFRCNSCFDPDVTTAGHQPIGFDEWSTFYNTYTVVGAKIKCTAGPPGNTTNTGAPLYFGITTNSSGTTINNLERLMELPRNKNNFLTYNPGSSGTRTVTSTYSAKKFFNVSNVKDNTLRLGADIGSNPDGVAIWQVGVGSIDPAVDLGNVHIMVEISYTVIFSNPKPLTQS